MAVNIDRNLASSNLALAKLMTTLQSYTVSLEC
jgi:hypothetical protein